MQSRARMLYHRSLVFIAATLSFVSACSLPPLNKEAAAAAVAAMESAPPEAAIELAAQGLIAIEKDRLPSSLLKNLDNVLSAPPEHTSELLAEMIFDNSGLLDNACAVGTDTIMEKLAIEAPEERNRIIWDDCKFEKHGLLTREAALQSGYGGLLIAHMIYARVASAGAVDENERILLVTLTASLAQAPETALENP